jgi:hypothetical protein
MTKTLVEQLRTEPDPEWFRALMIAAASRIEELERAEERADCFVNGQTAPQNQRARCKRSGHLPSIRKGLRGSV